MPRRRENRRTYTVSLKEPGKAKDSANRRGKAYCK